MSLVSDFAHYYNGTWIAQRVGNINCPVYVESVEQAGEFSSGDFSHEAEQALYILGERWNKNDQGQIVRERFNIPIFDSSLILESPDVGYLLHSRNVVSWTHINPVRQRAKGLISNKLRNGPNSGRGISGEMVYNLFNPDFPGLVTRFIFINPNDDKVYYKGALVGQVLPEDQRSARGQRMLNLLGVFKHITPDLEADYNVTLVETLV